MFRLYFLQMLNHTHHPRQTQTPQKIDCSISVLVECTPVVVRILHYFLRVGRKHREHWTHYISTFGKIHQLLCVFARSDKEKPVFDRTFLRSRKYLKSGKCRTCFKIISDHVSLLLPQVPHKIVHDLNYISMLVAGHEKHNPDLTLLFKFFLNGGLGLLVEVLVSSSQLLDFLFLPALLLLQPLQFG